MPKAVRVAGWGLVAAAVLTGAAVVGLRAYLASAGARQLAADKLTAMLGMPVAVTGLSAGLTGSTTVTLEVSGGPEAEPVLTGTVVANVSALGLARGASPTAIAVEDAKLTLRLDRDSKLLGKLPDPKGGGGPVPTVTVRRAAVRLIQEGRPEFTAAGLDGTLTPAGDRLALAGTADDPGWGKWLLAGDLAADGATGDVKLVTAGTARLGMDQLKSLPAVSPAAWRVIDLDGETTGTIRFARPAGGDWAYHVRLEPRNTTLGLLPTGLTVTDAAAVVGIEGLVVRVTGLTGKTAGGDVTADAVGDFAATPEVVTLKLTAANVDVTLLPRKWTAKLPPLDRGRLRAAAELVLKIKGDAVEPHGRGTGHVSGRLFGGSAELDVELVGDGRTFEFREPAKQPE